MISLPFSILARMSQVFCVHEISVVKYFEFSKGGYFVVIASGWSILAC
jgi:hypothetical protein